MPSVLSGMALILADIETDLLEYADFEEVNSVSRAKSFITAAKRWLILCADTSSNQSSSMSIGKSFVESMMSRATQFVAANAKAANGTSNRVRFLSSARFRG